MLFFEQYQIYKILYSYCITNKYADEKFIYDIVNIIIKSRKYKDDINKVELIKETNDGEVASYNYLTKEMLFTLPSQDKEIVRYNLEILHYILHECEHVQQYKQCNDKNNSLKKALLEESLHDTIFLTEIDKLDYSKLTEKELININKKANYCMLRYSIYHTIYKYLPSERMAEIDSFKYILNLLKNEKNPELCREKENYEKGYIIRELMGYKKENDKIVCPTFSMYQEFNKLLKNHELLNEIITSLSKYSENIDLDERIYLGLPITTEEFNSKLKKIARKNNN